MRGLGSGLPPPPLHRPNLPHPSEIPWRGQEGSLSVFPSSPPEAAGSRASVGRQEAQLAGKERRLCFQSWPSWAALGNILSH